MTFNNKKAGYRGDGAGTGWSNSPTGSGVIGDPFGPRPFSPHIFTVGFDYDFHRGVDVVVDEGGYLYSPINGIVSRWNFSHFGFQSDTQFNMFTEDDPSGSVSFSRDSVNEQLVLTGSRVGALTFPGGAGKFFVKDDYVSPQSNDWTIELEFSSSFTTAGGSVGFGIYNEAFDEYIALEYNGSTFTIRGQDSVGALTENGTTLATGSQTWMRIDYTESSDQISWQYSTDGSTFLDIATETTHNFTAGTSPCFRPMIYWLSSDTDASDNFVDINNFNYVDTSQTIGRFGNWLHIHDQNNRKFLMMHFQELLVSRGDLVSQGQIVGTAGLTGFDARSGRILKPHVHLEYTEDNGTIYTNDNIINPLSPNILPRLTGSTEPTISQSFGNDPDGSGSIIFDVRIPRNNQDFWLNGMEFTGSVGNYLLNWDDRIGLNDDRDIPRVSGTYMVPQRFSASSDTYDIAFYFQTGTYGEIFQSGSLLASGFTNFLSSSVDELSFKDSGFATQEEFESKFSIEFQSLVSASTGITGSELNFEVVQGNTAGSFWFDNNEGAFIWTPVTGAFDARTRVRVRNSADTGNPPATAFRICGLAVHDMDRTNYNYIHIGAGATSIGVNSVEWKTTDSNGGSSDTSAFNSVAFPTGGDLDIDLKIVRRASDLQVFDLEWRPTTGSVGLYQDILEEDGGWRSLVTVDRTDNTTPDRNGNGASADLAISLPNEVGVGLILYSNSSNHNIRGFFEEFIIRRTGR